MATARNAIEKTGSHADMKHMPPDMKTMLGNTGAQKSIKGILNSAKKMIPIIAEMGSSTDSGGEISGINRVHATVKGMRTASKFMADAKRFSALGKAFHSMREPQADFFLRHLLHFDGGHPEVVVPTPPEALAPASVGAPWPSRHFPTVEKYRQECDAPHERPTVVLLYSGLTYPYDSNDVVRALMDSLRKDCWVVPISIVAAGGESLEALRILLSEAAPKLIISMQGFRIGGGRWGVMLIPAQPCSNRSMPRLCIPSYSPDTPRNNGTSHDTASVRVKSWSCSCYPKWTVVWPRYR